MLLRWARSGHSSDDGERIGTLGKPCLRGGLDPPSDREHVFKARLGVLVQQRIMVGDTVTEALDQPHLGAEVLARQRGVRERGPQVVPPQLLVATSEESGPEPEGDTSDDASARDELALLQPLDRDDGLLDPIGLEDLEVEQPRVLDRRLRLTRTRTPSTALRRSTSK